MMNDIIEELLIAQGADMKRDHDIVVEWFHLNQRIEQRKARILALLLDEASK